MQLSHEPWKRQKNIFSQNGGRLKKKFSFLACFLAIPNFFKNSKIKNFDLSVVEAIEECIKNIHTKFQINRFIRT